MRAQHPHSMPLALTVAMVSRRSALARPATEPRRPCRGSPPQRSSAATGARSASIICLQQRVSERVALSGRLIQMVLTGRPCRCDLAHVHSLDPAALIDLVHHAVSVFNEAANSSRPSGEIPCGLGSSPCGSRILQRQARA